MALRCIILLYNKKTEQEDTLLTISLHVHPYNVHQVAHPIRPFNMHISTPGFDERPSEIYYHHSKTMSLNILLCV